MIKELKKHLKRSMKKHNVPGASVAVLRGKRIIGEAAAGISNLNTEVKVNKDTLFQIGSVTKAFTATMIMQMRDEGLLNLDDLILKYLPYFMNENMERLGKVTIRHLLSHQSGIDGDYFPSSQYGDHSIEGLLNKAARLPSLFEPGANYSYCNIGYVALGGIIETIDRCSFDKSLRQRIFEPLGMTNP
ncbi:MAG: beta-lactamase family protein [Planctomycetes bacterium]|nr:beta-lactamase family protein [Planctomycetota bacterium]